MPDNGIAVERREAPGPTSLGPRARKRQPLVTGDLPWRAPNPGFGFGNRRRSAGGASRRSIPLWGKRKKGNGGPARAPEIKARVRDALTECEHGTSKQKKSRRQPITASGFFSARNRSAVIGVPSTPCDHLHIGEVRRLLDPAFRRGQAPEIAVDAGLHRAWHRLVVDVDDLDAGQQEFGAVAVRIAQIGIVGVLVPVPARPVLEPVLEAEIAGDVAGADDVVERLHHIAAVMKARPAARAGTRCPTDCPCGAGTCRRPFRRFRSRCSRRCGSRDPYRTARSSSRPAPAPGSGPCAARAAPRCMCFLVCMRGTVGMVAQSSTGVPAGSLKCSVRPWCGTSTNFDSMPVLSKCAFALSRSSSMNTRKPTRSHIGCPLVRFKREAVMAALLDAAQPQRIGRLVGDDQPDHLGVEIAACGEIARGEDEMARPRDVERREEVGFRQFPHLGRRASQLLICTPVSRTILPHCASSRSIISP